jgi:hypothetical protein
VLAGREQDVELARVRFVGDRRGEAEQFVGRVAHGRDDHDEVMTSGALACDPSRDRLIRSAPATDEPPYFWTTRGRACGAFYCRVSGAPNRKRC